MKRLASIVLVTAILVAAGASFVAGRAMSSRQESAGWLQDAPAEVRQTDLQFEEQAKQLVAGAGSQRSRLSALLVEASTTDRQILEQADRMIESNTVLIKAVAGHVAALHSSLSQPQRQCLMTCCAGCMQGLQRRYRYRGGAQDQTTWQGRGAGRGRMWRYRGGSGSAAGQCLVRQLQLTPEQTTQAQTQDPNFGTDAADLVQKLDQAQAALLAGFENAQIGSEELLKRADNLAAARSDLDRRVARHVALIHAFLSPQQRQMLAQLVDT
jgi:hypothetical protein